MKSAPYFTISSPFRLALLLPGLEKIRAALAEVVTFMRALFLLLTPIKLHLSWKTEAYEDKSR